MKQTPILMTAPMVRATLDGSKTQTRRIVKSPAKHMQAAGMEVIKYREPGDSWYKDHVWSMRNAHGVWGDYTNENFLKKCPYGLPRDRLWVRETWQAVYFSVDPETGYTDDCYSSKEIPETKSHWTPVYAADRIHSDSAEDRGWLWRPSIHMPGWASRITLEITGIRVERLNGISAADAIAEGIEAVKLPPTRARWWRDYDAEKLHTNGLTLDPVLSYASLWESINGIGSWAANPWVWVIEFRRTEP